METKDRKENLRQLIEALVRELMPKSAEDESGDMSQRNLPTRQLIQEAAFTIYATVRRYTLHAFEGRLLAGEACVLYIAFAGAPVLPVLILLGIALSVLVLRDGYIHPAEGSPHETATDALVTGTVMLMFEVLFGAATPWLSLPAETFGRGMAAGLLMVSAWRMVFRMKTPAEQPGRPALQAYKSTGRMTGLWIIACLTLIITNSNVIAAASAIRNFLVPFLTPVVLALAYRLSFNVLGGITAKSKPLKLSDDSYKLELAVKRDSLWQPATKWSLCLQILFFVLLALPSGIALWRLFSAGEAAATVNRLQAGANFGAFVTLSIFWIHIKKLNRDAARALQEEIDKRNNVGVRI